MRVKLFIIISIISFLFCHIKTYGQSNIIKGDIYYNRDMYEDAIFYYLKDIVSSDSKIKKEASLKLANCYKQTGKFFEAEEIYKNLWKTYGKKEPIYIFEYANALRSSAKYDEAIMVFQDYKKSVPTDKIVDTYIESCRLAEEWLIEGETYKVKNFTQINTTTSDVAPTLIGKDTLIFCSSRDGSTKKLVDFSGVGSGNLLDFYFVDLNIEPFIAENKTLLKTLNSPYHEGPATFAKFGKEAYLTKTVRSTNANKDNTITSTLNIFLSKRNDLAWSTPSKAFSFGNDYSIAHPSISEDSKKIYFTSDMPGGFGGFDIYVTVKDNNGTWGAPVNLGKEVNTTGNEMWPSIYQDSILYFSSDAHPGLGKKDIFKASLKNGKWTNIENLKPPINSIANDFCFSRIPNTNKGFFSSDRFNGIGLEDIYTFIKNDNIYLTIDMNNFSIKDESFFNDAVYKVDNKETEAELTPVIKDKTEKKFTFSIPDNKLASLVERKEMVTNKVDIEVQTNISDNKHLEIKISPKMENISFDGYIKRSLTQDNKDGRKYTKINYPVKKSVVSLYENDNLVKQIYTNSLGFYNLDTTLYTRKKYKIVAEGGEMIFEDYNAKVIDNYNNPIANAEVSLFNDKKELCGFVKTDLNGDFFFLLSPINDFSLNLKKEGYIQKNIPLARDSKKSFQKNPKIHVLQINEEELLNKLLAKTVINKNDLICIGKTLISNNIAPNSNIIIFNNKDTVKITQSNEQGLFLAGIPPKSTIKIYAYNETNYSDTIIISTFKKDKKERIKINIDLKNKFNISETIEVANNKVEEDPFEKSEIAKDTLIKLDLKSSDTDISTEVEEINSLNLYTIEVANLTEIKHPDIVRDELKIKDQVSLIKVGNQYKFIVMLFDNKEEAYNYQIENIKTPNSTVIELIDGQYQFINSFEKAKKIDSISKSVTATVNPNENSNYVYRVQIAAGYNLFDPSIIKKNLNITDPISIYKVNDIYKYTLLNFDTYEEAVKYKSENFKFDCFISKFPRNLEPVYFEKHIFVDRKIKIQGRIYNKYSKPTSANIEFSDINDNKVITTTISNEFTGDYEAYLNSGKIYAMVVTKDGYLFHSDKIDLETADSNLIVNKDINIKPIDTGSVITLQNIFFDFGKSIVKPNSYPELDRIVKLMEENPNIIVEVSGHTCNVGTYNFNKKLSEDRARAICKYIYDKNIDRFRLIYIGHSYDFPKDSNETEEGRQKNRRADLKIIKK